MAATLRHALVRFANLLALGTNAASQAERPMDVGLALVMRSGAGVQLQARGKPDCTCAEEKPEPLHVLLRTYNP